MDDEKVLERCRSFLNESGRNTDVKMSRLLIILADKPQYMKTLCNANRMGGEVFQFSLENIFKDDEETQESKRFHFVKFHYNQMFYF